MTGVVNPRQSALEVPLCRHHFSRKLLALLELEGDRLRPTVALSECSVGATVILQRVKNQSEPVLRFLREAGVEVGIKLVIKENSTTSGIHLLSLLDQRTGFTLAQSEVDGKTNENKTALALLKSVVLADRVITGGAMFCQRDLCQQITDDGGHFFFEVKDNQSELKKSIEAEFQPAFPPLH
jgi:hypothetical protein